MSRARRPSEASRCDSGMSSSELNRSSQLGTPFMPEVLDELMTLCEDESGFGVDRVQDLL